MFVKEGGVLAEVGGVACVRLPLLQMCVVFHRDQGYDERQSGLYVMSASKEVVFECAALPVKLNDA